MMHNQQNVVNNLLKGRRMIVPLMEAVADTCGGKAAALGALLRAGLPVPDGFVVPFAAYLAAVRELDLGSRTISTLRGRRSGRVRSTPPWSTRWDARSASSAIRLWR
jgi:phosphoenolpyruvate synthase/pyruvate phosphate dikinase